MFNQARFDLILALTGEKMIDAAEAMGISMASLYNKRHGKNDFTSREIEAFCRHYMVSPMDVFFEGLEDDLRKARSHDKEGERSEPRTRTAPKGLPQDEAHDTPEAWGGPKKGAKA
jgi:hypothetical protein